LEALEVVIPEPLVVCEPIANDAELLGDKVITAFAAELGGLSR
jgi:hypothetical protein